MNILLRSVNDDWEELFIDGKLMLEGHSLSLHDVIPLVKPQDAEFTQAQVNRCIYCETVLPENAHGFKCVPQCAHD